MNTDSSAPFAGAKHRRIRRGIFPLALLLCLAFAATAQAHNFAATTACGATGNTVTLNWTNFESGSGNNGENTPEWSVVYTPTGGSPVTQTGSVTFPDGTDSLTVPIPSGAGSAVASSSWTSSQTTDGNANSYSVNLTVPSCLASPTIATTASPGVEAGGTISDEAVLSGGRSPTGTITFKLYTASDTTCSTALATGTATVSGNGTYSSPVVTETQAGSYQWVASYSGDANNGPAADLCGEPAEQVTVTPAPPPPTTPPGPSVTPSTPPSTPTPPAKSSPSIVTKASPGVLVGGKISDQAVLSGGSSPTGTITFHLYLSTDKTCSKALVTGTVTVKGNGTYSSPVVTETKVGTYQWVATYSGDSNNTGVSDGCGQAAEQVSVTIPPKPACVASKVFLLGRFGQTVDQVFTARLEGIGVKSVTFYLDGHKLSTVTKSHNHVFTISIGLGSVSYGLHSVKAKATLKNKNCHAVVKQASFVHGTGGS